MAGTRKANLENLALAQLSKKRGRPKGTLSQSTLDKLRVKKKLDQRFLRASDKIANAQIALAQGVAFLYKIHTNEKGIRGKPELITSQYEIESYLDGVYEGDEHDYYYIHTKEPNNQAIDSIFNRVHGKPTESVAMTVEVFSLKALADKRKRIAIANELQDDTASLPAMQSEEDSEEGFEEDVSEEE